MPEVQSNIENIQSEIKTQEQSKIQTETQSEIQPETQSGIQPETQTEIDRNSIILAPLT